MSPSPSVLNNSPLFQGMFTESLRSFLGVLPKKNRYTNCWGNSTIHFGFTGVLLFGQLGFFKASFMGRGMIWHRCHVSIMLPSRKNLAKMNRASTFHQKGSNRYLLGIVFFGEGLDSKKPTRRLETDSTTRNLKSAPFVGTILEVHRSSSVWGSESIHNLGPTSSRFWAENQWSTIHPQQLDVFWVAFPIDDSSIAALPEGILTVANFNISH